MCTIKIQTWLTGDKNPNLIFRIAVPEVESWVYADIVNFPKQFRCQYTIPNGADATEDGKKFLFTMIKKTAPKIIQEEILPEIGTSAKIGKGYNLVLCNFVARYWDPHIARLHSKSLHRAIVALERYNPV